MTFNDVYEEHLKHIGFEFNEINDKEIKIWHKHLWWTALLYKNSEISYSVSFYFRTNFGIGERSDIHEIIPLIFTLFSRIEDGCTFRFVRELHPFTGIDDEIYATYIFPSQPLSENIRLSSERDLNYLIDFLTRLLFLSAAIQQLLEINEDAYSCDREHPMAAIVNT